MQKAHSNIDWVNYPSMDTPINETNLNKMDRSIDTIDDRVVTMDTTKADVTVVNGLVKSITLNDTTGVFTITYQNGSTSTIDTLLEKLAINFDYDATTQKLIIYLSDGTTKEVDLSALITQNEFDDTNTIGFTVTNGVVKANVLDGSITESKLQPNYLAECKSARDSAQTSESNASASATLSQSYAKGGTGTRSGEDTDNAKYYMEQAKAVAKVDIATTTTAGIVKPDGTSIHVATDGTIDCNGKADTLTYDEDNSLLYLKSGSTVLSSVEIAGGGASSIIHVDTHEEDWKGNQNVLVEIFDDTKDYQGHFDANGDYFHKVQTIGVHVVKVTEEDGTEWESSVNVTTIGGVYYVYVERSTWGYAEWLASANITDTFGSLASVLADQVTVRKLMTIHASADYLCEWVAEDDSVRATIFANAYAMKWIGLRDYICDKLMADYKDEMLESDNWEYILKDKVPVMTSNSAPYGEVINSGTLYYTNYAWHAFDSDDSTSGYGSTTTTNAYIGYKFTNPICVRCFEYLSNPLYPNRGIKDYKIQYSNDGTTWTDAKTGTFEQIGTIQKVTFENDVYALYWRLFYVNHYGGEFVGVMELQFYGRSLNVSSNDVGTLPPQTEPKITIGGVTYWTNKTEREFAEGSNIKYLYDNGVELEEISCQTQSSTCYAKKEPGYLYISKTSGQQVSASVSTNEKINLTSFNKCFLVGGNIIKSNTNLATVCIGTGKIYDGNSSSFLATADSGLKNKTVVADISSINQEAYIYSQCDWTQSVECIRTYNEWWLE